MDEIRTKKVPVAIKIMFRSNNQDKNNNILVKIFAQTSYFWNPINQKLVLQHQVNSIETNRLEPSSDQFLRQRWTMELKNQIFRKWYKRVKNVKEDINCIYQWYIVLHFLRQKETLSNSHHKNGKIYHISIYTIKLLEK